MMSTNDLQAIKIFDRISSVYLAAVIICGTALNGKALHKLIKVIKIHNTEQNFFLFNLIFSEFVISLFAMPSDFFNSIFPGKGLTGFLCPSIGFIHTFFGLNSLASITAMAFIRYLSVARMQRSWHSKTQTHIWTSKHLWTLWVFSLMFAMPPLFGFGEYKADSSMLCCTPNWSASSLPGVTYNWILISLGFIFPTILIIASNFFVMRKIRQQNSIRKRRRSSSVKILRRSIEKNDQDHHIKANIKSDTKTAKNTDITIKSTIALMTASFYACWTPYAVRCILAMFGVDLSKLPSTLTILFAKLGILVNPIIYIFYNKEISGPAMTAALLARSTAEAVSLAMKGELLTRSGTLSVSVTNKRRHKFNSQRSRNSGLKSQDSNEEKRSCGSIGPNSIITLHDSKPKPHFKASAICAPNSVEILDVSLANTHPKPVYNYGYNELFWEKILSERNEDTLLDQNEKRISDDNIRVTRTNSSPYLFGLYQNEEGITTQIKVTARRRSSLETYMLLYSENDDVSIQEDMYLRERNSSATNGKSSYV